MLPARILPFAWLGVLVLVPAAGRAGAVDTGIPCGNALAGRQVPAARAVAGVVDSLRTAHFRILFTLDSASPHATTKDYVDRLAVHLEHAWDVYTTDPAFGMPPAVGAGPPGETGEPLIDVSVLRLEDAFGYAHAEAPLPGDCYGASASLRITTVASDGELRLVAAHEVWHAFTYRLGSYQGSWLEESTARWAEWQVYPDTRWFGGVWEMQRRPYVPLDWHSPEARMYGSALYWQFLQERWGPLVPPVLWKRTCADWWFETLEPLLGEAGIPPLDATLVEFWRWNYRTGYAADGRHYRDAADLPLLAFQYEHRTYDHEVHEVPERFRAYPAGTNALLFVGPATRETLRIRLDGSPRFAGRRNVSVIVTTWPNTHVDTGPQDGDAAGDYEFVIPDWHLADHVVLLLTNHFDTWDIPWEDLAFTWTAEEEGAPVYDTLWNLSLEEMQAVRLVAAPNPFAAWTQIRYRVDPGGPAWVGVFDVAGRLVRTLVDGRTSAVGEDAYVNWDGTDGSGRSLPSGVYFLSARSAAGRTTRPIHVLR